MRFLDDIKIRARSVKKDILALYLAYRRPDVPLAAKIAAAITVVYALSPVDLIPDFISILGNLDDLIFFPLGIIISVKLMPKNIMDECRLQAEEIYSSKKPKKEVLKLIL